MSIRLSQRTAATIVVGVAATLAGSVWALVELGRWTDEASWRLPAVLVGSFGLLCLVALVTARITHAGLRSELERHRHSALHDGLTGLPNRVLFDDRLTQVARQRRRSGQEAAVMVVDLDRFKHVNDTLGHRAGDQLLAEVARRLTARLRQSDTVARLGGDEFGVLLPMVSGLAGVEKVVDGLRRALSAPFAIGTSSITIDASIGVAIIDEQAHPPDTYVHRADRAMYRAKKDGVGSMIHQPGDERDGRETPVTPAELRRAIAGGELRLFYQPKARLSDGRIRSLEALVRWQHPERGLLTPDRFIAMAESSGLMRQLTYWVLDEAMRQARVWADMGRPLRVAVNLSQQSLLDTAIHREISLVLERHRVPAKALEIEITESALVADLKAANVALTDLARKGIALSIDDYGTGHSSLAHVRGLPVNVIKIDRSFVAGMLVDAKNAAIVRSTVQLAQDLGLQVVAEGVESAEDWHALAELGCHYVQGYLVSRPLAADALLLWLQDTGYAFAPAPAQPEPDFVMGPGSTIEA